MRLNEFSTEKLAQYKTAAAADAAKADAAGDVARGHKRFKGINTATKKQFANDAKKSQLKEFAPSGDDGDGFSDETLKRLAAQWYNGDEDPRVEQTLMSAGWEIGQDEGYNNGGVFVVRAGDDQGDSYISWPAEDLQMNEVAPPGAKAERMVRHIKQGYAKDGKLTPKEKGIAFATAWKAHNAGQVEEATDPTRDKLERMIWKYYGKIYDYGDDDGLDYLDRNGELWNQLMDKYNGEIEDIVAQEPIEVLMQAAQELKGIAGDMKYELDEAAQGHTIEAHGVRGMDRRTWHKTFKNTDQMIAWAEKHDAEIVGTRDLEQARHHNLSPAEQGVAEGKEDKIKQLKQDYATAVHWSKNDTNPHKREAARQKAEKIKAHLEKQYKQGVAEGLPGGFSKSDYMPGATVKNPNTSCKRCNGRGTLWKAPDGKILPANDVTGAKKYKCGACDGIGMAKKEVDEGVSEGLTEMDKSQTPPGRDGDPRPGPEKIAKPITKEKMVNRALDALTKSMAKKDDKKKDVKEDSISAMRRLAGIVPQVPAVVPNGPRQYRHMPTAVQPR